MNRGFNGSMSREIDLPCVLLEEQTWTQNHVFTQILTYVHYSITIKRDSLNKNSTGELPLFPNILACVQPPLSSKKNRIFFLRGGAAVHRLTIYLSSFSEIGFQRPKI